MNAIAPHRVDISTEHTFFVRPAAAIAGFEPDQVREEPASPWRAPMFYMAFLAGALLLVAVAIILTWRLATGTRLARRHRR